MKELLWLTYRTETIVSEFKLRSFYYIQFLTNTLGIGIIFFIHQAKG